ncbi:HPr family phosphocarrier protein [Solibacillus sp. MA9]|uniref:Phosphocarrier protein HPr n=1 Tax=Solibacillus palustris TaxID=2908203 RepID=A0ABS9UAP3_9BACL|nr:HPr family phosphocarrier protein [Solibacillus sp. MA9]MCH7321397.1 HPr family phosphocarrier protein [Solibacillus sp. MA9]
MNKTYTIPFSEGLHARPASQFVQLVQDFDGHVQIDKEGKRINGKSVIHIMTLGAKKGDQLTIALTGEETAEAELFARLDDFFSA